MSAVTSPPARAAALLALLVPLVLVVPGLAAPAARAAEPCPPQQACLVVRMVQDGVETATRVVTVEELRGWQDLVDGLEYPVREQPGGPTRPEAVEDAVTVRELVIWLAGDFDDDNEGFKSLSPDAVESAEVGPVDAPPALTLATADLAPIGENGFDAGLAPALYLPEGETVLAALRPLRPDAADVNTDELVRGGPGEPLELVLRSSAPRVEVSIGAGLDDVATVGESVGLAAAVRPRTSGLAYRWTFGDGAGSDQQAPRHTYTAPGTYLIRLAVAGPDGLRAQSNTVVLRVDGPADPGEDPDDEPDGGPGGGDGGGAGGGAGGGSGTGGSGNPLTGPDRGEGDTGGQGTAEEAGNGGSPTPGPSVPSPEVPTVDDGAAPEIPAVPPAGDDPLVLADPPIRGLLLTDRVPLAATPPTPPPPATTLLGTPRTAPAARAGGAGEGSGPTGPLALGAVVLLLVVGALRDHPRLLRRKHP
ncbi:PKD domain-containing protein [Nocardioides sp.]|uniref:PKD domain-containing protein n=1 Tax=Nocardioides sp. TaxID=35761 RepID=UPI0035170A40